VKIRDAHLEINDFCGRIRQVGLALPNSHLYEENEAIVLLRQRFLKECEKLQKLITS
jgi:hypothetical protein